MKFTGERVIPDAMHNNIDTYQSHLARYVWALQFVKGKNVLDAACGTGYGSRLLADVAQEVIGVDNCQKTIDYAKQLNDQVSNTEFVIDNLNKLRAWQQSIVVTFETIEHLDDPVKFLKYCKHVAPEVIGSIPVSCPTPFHKHVWDKEQIIALIHSIGFKNVTFWIQHKMNIYDYMTMFKPEIILFRGIR